MKKILNELWGKEQERWTEVLKEGENKNKIKLKTNKND